MIKIDPPVLFPMPPLWMVVCKRCQQVLQIGPTEPSASDVRDWEMLHGLDHEGPTEIGLVCGTMHGLPGEAL